MTEKTRVLYDYIEQNSLARYCRENELLSLHSSMKVGGGAELFIVPCSRESLEKIIAFARETGVPFFIFGNGTNILFLDGGTEGAAICLKDALTKISINGDRITCEAGVSLSQIAGVARENSLTGLEFAAGIPGTLGGAVYMNAGAFGSEMKNVVEKSIVLTPRGEIKTIVGDEHAFGYRRSVFGENGCIVLESTLLLSKGDRGQITAKMEELAGSRREKQPLNYPSAGSVFKRPEGSFTGKLIEDAGLKGVTIGGAQVSEKHAGFIINRGGATAKDVTRLIAHVGELVYKESGVQLELEIKIMGNAN